MLLWPTPRVVRVVVLGLLAGGSLRIRYVSNADERSSIATCWPGDPSNS